MSGLPSRSSESDSSPWDDERCELSARESLDLRAVVMSLRSLAGFVLDTSDVLDELPRQIGKYSIIDRIGQGGQAVVYLAYDSDAQRMVVIKRYRSGVLSLGGSGIIESRALCSVEHPSIVKCLAVEQDETSDYLVLQPVAGQALQQYWQQHSIEPWQAVRWIIDVAEGLEQLQSVGLVHRDIAARNLIVTADRRLMLVDFGMVRPLGRASECEGSAVDSFGDGNELVLGDVRALGTLLRQMLFEYPALKNGVHDPARDPRWFSQGARRQLSSIARRACDSKRKDSIRTPRELASELQLAIRRQQRRGWLTQWGAAAAGLSIASALPASFVWWYRQPDPAQKPVSQAQEEWSLFVRHWLMQDGRLPPLPRLLRQFPLEARLNPDRRDAQGWWTIDSSQSFQLELQASVASEATVYLLALSSDNAPSLSTSPLFNSDRRPLRLEENRNHSFELPLGDRGEWFGFLYLIASNGPLSDPWRRSVTSLPLREFGGHWIDASFETVSPWQWASELLVPIRMIAS